MFSLACCSVTLRFQACRCVCVACPQVIGPMLLFPEETLLRTGSSQLHSFLEGTYFFFLLSCFFVLLRLCVTSPNRGAGRGRGVLQSELRTASLKSRVAVQRLSAVRTASTSKPGCRDRVVLHSEWQEREGGEVFCSQNCEQPVFKASCEAQHRSRIQTGQRTM